MIQLWGIKPPFRGILFIPGTVGGAKGNPDLHSRAFLKCFKWQCLVGVKVFQKCSEWAWLKGQARENAILLNKSFVQSVIITANQSNRRRRGWEDRHHVGSALLLPALQANIGYSCKTTCPAKGCLLARYYNNDRSLSLS